MKYLRSLTCVTLLALLGLGCGSDEQTESDLGSQEQAGEQESFGDDALAQSPGDIYIYTSEETGLGACLGYKENKNWPEEYQLFCEEFISEDDESSGQKCFSVGEEDKPGTPCYCLVCAISGAVKKCVKECCGECLVPE